VTTVNSTLPRSKTDRLMTRRMSLVAFRYSSASCNSRLMAASSASADGVVWPAASTKAEL
jgi:hypothetical protein